MKKSVLAIILAAFCMTLCACDNSKDSGDSSINNEVAKTPSEKAAELLEKVEFPEMVELSGELIEASFTGISKENLSEYHVYRCGSGAHPDEFGIIIANDAETAAKLKDAVADWLQYQSDLYRDYTPAEAYKLEDSFVNIVDFDTVVYAVCDNNALARDILE